MYNILVKNGFTYLGSNLIRYFLSINQDYKIINIDDCENIYDTLDDIISDNYIHIKCGSYENNFLTFILKTYNINIIINFNMDYNNHQWFINSNILYNSCIEYGKINKIIEFSSDDIYDKENTNIYFESDNLYPNNKFSCYNMYMENTLKMFYNKDKIPYIICRICNIFGNINNKNVDYISNMLQNIVHNKNVSIYNDGNDLNSYLHIFDLCEAINIIILKGQIDNIYNIGSHENISENQIINLFIDQMIENKKSISKYEIFSFKNSNYFNKKTMSIQKLMNIGWNGPTISIYDEIKKYVQLI